MQSIRDGSTKIPQNKISILFCQIGNRFAHVLLNQGLINKSIIDELTRTPIVEGTDFPSTNGCSNHITLVIRFCFFHSDLLLHYENSKSA